MSTHNPKRELSHRVSRADPAAHNSMMPGYLYHHPDNPDHSQSGWSISRLAQQGENVARHGVRKNRNLRPVARSMTT